MAFNVWADQGTVITDVSGVAEQPTVIYEGGAQILSGNVFKMWYSVGTAAAPTGINYAESTDGKSWTLYGSNPVIASRWGPRVFKYAGTYYLYCTLNVFGTAIEAYTSPDGITWTRQNASALAVSGSGWDSVAVGQFNVCDVVGGTWYGYYWGIDTETNEVFNEGLATSSDGIHWTKSLSNPIASMGSGIFIDGASWSGSGAFCFAKVGSIYYGWSQTTALNVPGGNNNLPTDIMRWSAPSPSGPWTPLNVLTFYRTTSIEGLGGSSGQAADPSVVEANGNVYIFFTATSNGDGAHYVINCAIASGMTLAQLVQTYEGVQNVPFPDALSLNLNPLGSDSFQRANANPIGGNWTQAYNGVGWSAGQLAGHLYECATAGDRADSYWNAATFPNDQWSTITVGSITGASSYVATDFRIAGADAGTYYDFAWGGAATGGSGTYYMQRYASGTLTTIATGSMTVSNGDTLTGCVIGTNIYIYQNGALIFLFTDSHIASGSAGLLALGAASADATISAWSGGGFQNAPPIPPPSSTAWYPVDCRDYSSFPLTPVIVQGSGIYALDPNSDNSKLPPTDSRKVKPTDDRVSTIIPENSRNNPNPNA